jgi:hypothetical protein
MFIGTESSLREEINNAEVFRDDCTTFRRDRCTRGDGVLICVKNYIDCRELRADEGFEMIAIQVKGRDPNFTWEILGIYRTPDDDMRIMKKLAARTGYTGNSTKRNIIGDEVNITFVDWNGNVGCNSRTQVL